MCSTIKTLYKVMGRKKLIDEESVGESELGRVLNVVDLTALGVGSTLGIGVYVLIGEVARDDTGPSIVISFLIAAIASVFAGLCYGEFGVRVPRAGSAYIYSYVCVGELVAFVIGWNMILEYVLGSASVARGMSIYLDTLMNHTMKNCFLNVAPIRVRFLSTYFDFFSCCIPLILAVALSFGLKESSWINNVVTLINILVVLFFIIAGSAKTSTKNWYLPGNSSNPAIGDGGFFPFGFHGMMKGAASCFYGFVGFDSIATTGEEVKNPKKAIPLSILLSLCIVFLVYFGVSTVITLMIPYYKQDKDAPIPAAFETVGWTWAKWIVTIGGLFGLVASLFGAMFPLPRIIYAMASDRILFRFLGKISPKFKTPVIGTMVGGAFIAFTAGIFDLDQLVDMMSLGTLMAYSMVAASVLLLRYIELDNERSEETTTDQNNTPPVWKVIFNCGQKDVPNLVSEKIVKVEVCLFFILCILCGLCVKYLTKFILKGVIWAIFLTASIFCFTILVVISMATQPQSRKVLAFKVPCVPLIPVLSIFMNVYLMLNLNNNTWIRFAIWMVIGFSIYGFYSLPYSVKTYKDPKQIE